MMGLLKSVSPASNMNPLLGVVSALFKFLGKQNTSKVEYYIAGWPCVHTQILNALADIRGDTRLSPLLRLPK